MTSGMGAQDQQAYVEWRRALPFDPHTQMPADEASFLRVMASIGLYVQGATYKPKIKDQKVVGVELNLQAAGFQNSNLTFYRTQDGKITIEATGVDVPDVKKW